MLTSKIITIFICLSSFLPTRMRELTHHHFYFFPLLVQVFTLITKKKSCIFSTLISNLHTIIVKDMTTLPDINPIISKLSLEIEFKTMIFIFDVTKKKKKQGVPDLSEYGDVYELGFGLGHDQPPTSALIKKEFQRKIIYHMSPQEVNSCRLIFCVKLKIYFKILFLKFFIFILFLGYGYLDIIIKLCFFSDTSLNGYILFTVLDFCY